MTKEKEEWTFFLMTIGKTCPKLKYSTAAQAAQRDLQYFYYILFLCDYGIKFKLSLLGINHSIIQVIRANYLLYCTVSTSVRDRAATPSTMNSDNGITTSESPTAPPTLL